MIPTLQLAQWGRASAVGAVPATDPHFANVSLLLHMDGSNGSTTITDNSPSPQTLTANGNAQISTAQSVFGGACLALDGSGDYVSCPAFAGIQFGSGNFTVEFRFRTTVINQRAVIFGQGNSAGSNSSGSVMIELTAGNLIEASGFSGSSQVAICTGTTSIAAGVWYAGCYERSGNDFRLMINGTVEDSANVSTTLNTSTNALGIGRFGEFTSSLYVTGFIDEMRVTKGVARYGGNYTLAASAFPNS